MLLRVLLICAIALGAIAPASDIGGKRHTRFVFIAWTPQDHQWAPDTAEILIINRSTYLAEDVETAIRMWELPRIPSHRFAQEAPQSCEDTRPQRGAVILCVGTVRPGDTAGVSGWAATYTRKISRGGRHKMHKLARYTQAGIIGLVPRPDFTSDDAQNTVAHEYGHVLGLGHLDCACVMRGIAGKFTELASEDIAALRQLYP